MTTPPRTSGISNLARAQLAPKGRIRAGIAVGSASSAVWSTWDETAGRPQGVTVDLALALGHHTGLEVELVRFGSSGAIIDAADADAWDVSFTPVDAERKKWVSFGTDYFLGTSTYMVAGASGIRSLADVDHASVTIVGVEGTATLRSARRSVSAALVLGVSELTEALEMFTGGRATAVALGRESLLSLVSRFPGARILDGHFHATGTAIAMPHGREAGLEAASRFIERAKSDGTIRAIFDRHGMADVEVAPPNSRS